MADGGNGHFYELVSHGAITWEAARGLAASMGGYLATVTSADEMAFINVVNDLDSSAFLGAADTATEGDWIWADGPEAGQALTYANWYPGEPNNAGNEDVMIMVYASGQWNDIPTTLGIANSIVEYQTLTADVPLPMAVPLLLAGIGMIGVAARRRRG